jgi:hypothetical protein
MSCSYRGGDSYPIGVQDLGLKGRGRDPVSCQACQGTHRAAWAWRCGLGTHRVYLLYLVGLLHLDVLV